MIGCGNIVDADAETGNVARQREAHCCAVVRVSCQHDVAAGVQPKPTRTFAS